MFSANRSAILFSKSTIEALADAVQGGSTFSDGLAQHPRIFNDLYVNMVKAGELGGVLEVVLTRLAEFQEKAQKIKNKVIAAMVYPIIVMCWPSRSWLSSSSSSCRSSKRFFTTCSATNRCPAITLFVIGVSNFVQNHWPILIGVIVALIVGYQISAHARRGGRVFIDRFKLRLPLFGDLLRKTAISRFSRTLGTLVTSGVPILQALNITRETAGNTVIASAISQVHDSVKEGESIVQPLEASGAFPPMVISMIDVGEETGQLPECF